MGFNYASKFKRTLLATAVLGSLSGYMHAETIVGKDINSSNGPNQAINALLSANRGTNGGGDQSLQFGDNLHGSENDDVMIGGLGIDVLKGGAGDDILIGGTEDFNPLNRDRAFGGSGEDVFLWAPGDGNDYFDGGDDTDVVVFGLIGEQKNAEGAVQGAPFFAVNAPGNSGNSVDTELGLWAANGQLLESDDDIVLFSNTFSAIDIFLDEGEYFLGISEFNAFFADGFSLTGPRFDEGDIASLLLNINGAFSGNQQVGQGSGLAENAFFRVEVAAVPEPASLALIALGLVGLGLTRRRA